jgi:superkiller protein 3
VNFRCARRSAQRSSLARGYLCIALLWLLCLSSFAVQNSQLAEARRLFAAGSYDQASRLLEDSLKTQPNDADIHLLLGQTYALQGRRTEAIQQFTRTLELRPDSALAYNALGAALNRFAEFDQARKAFEQAIALDPRLTDAHVNLAMSLAQTGDMTGATQHLQTAIQLQPKAKTAATAHYLLARIFAEDDSHRALDELSAAVRIEPRDQQAWLALGRLRRDMNDEPGALTAFQQAVACDPRDPDSQYELGSEYLAQGDARRAAVHLELARKAMPSVTLAVLYKLDRALRAQNRMAEARQVQSQVQALLTQDVQANQHFVESQTLENEGIALEKGGDVAKALAKYHAALELNPQQAGFRLNYALALCRLDRWREGIAEINEILQSDPGNIEARHALFIAEDKAKQAAKPSAPARP